MAQLAASSSDEGLRIARDADLDVIVLLLNIEMKAAIDCLLVERGWPSAEARRAHYRGLAGSVRELIGRLRLPISVGDFATRLPEIEIGAIDDLQLLALDLPLSALPPDLRDVQNARAVQAGADILRKSGLATSMEADARAVQQVLIGLAPRVLGLLVAAAELGQRRASERRRRGPVPSSFSIEVFCALTGVHWHLFGCGPRIVVDGKRRGPSIRWARKVLCHLAKRLPEATPTPEVQACVIPIRDLAYNQDTTLGKHFLAGQKRSQEFVRK